MRRIDNDAQRGECEPMRCRKSGDDVGFHIDRGGAGEAAQLALSRRVGDRRVDADHRRVMSVPDGMQKLLRPCRIGRPRALRFGNRRGDDPVAGAKLFGQAAGNAEADDAAIAVARRAGDGRLQFVPGVARKHVNAGSRGDPGFKRHADEGDDGAAVLLNKRARGRAGVIRAQQAFRNVEICF